MCSRDLCCKFLTDLVLYCKRYFTLSRYSGGSRLQGGCVEDLPPLWQWREDTIPIDSSCTTAHDWSGPHQHGVHFSTGVFGFLRLHLDASRRSWSRRGVRSWGVVWKRRLDAAAAIRSLYRTSSTHEVRMRKTKGWFERKKNANAKASEVRLSFENLHSIHFQYQSRRYV